LPNADKCHTRFTYRMLHELRSALERQGYHILGERGAFKACQWQQKSLTEGRTCYKQKFYGIESHRCVQMTPVVDKCTQECQFCWRVTPSDIGVMWDQTSVTEDIVLDPEELLDAVLAANLRSLGGYNPEVAVQVERRTYLEAREPKHVAISLAGEPTLYPMLSEFIDLVRSRGMTSFLVTNGTQPEVLSKISPPTQLYVTLAAPDRETYRGLCRPLLADGWERLLQSQELLSSLSCRTVNRLTMVSGWNMSDPRSYARLISMGEPDFVEVKGYMFLGSSRGRLKADNTPSHSAVRAFSEKISALTGYYLQDEQTESRVVLLSRSKHIRKIQ